MNGFPNDDELLQILKPNQTDIEDSFVERKKGFGRQPILKTIVAFANTVPEERFAVIFVGVKNNGEIVNVQDVEKREQDVRVFCNDVCYPPIKNYKTRVLKVDKDTSILAIIINENNEKPYFTGRAFIRQGSSNIDATEEQYNKLIAFRNSVLYKISKLKLNEVVTVVSKGRDLAANTTRGPSYRRAKVCYVEDWNLQFVTFKTLNTQEKCSEPVSKITLSYDDAHYRPKFIIDE